ncbi:DUF421 domain-containing protein [Halobacillus salinarum]|uniref:DUF421 domain-containing protein n=1 Tax=Halobacillus salinarum TaxID=2932257 RepID=A0ABY4EKL2_9BACI|nr:YetF domain-containing protein [Halobacillus salinarum]UOQ45009.1 DUF421 domain-containing protein [Halobacillus salinarum]
MMEATAYITRCVFMLIVTWTAIRLIGKKSISNMTSYDLAAIMLITTVAAEPLVYKIPSKSTIGVITLTISTILLGFISLKKFFYNIDSLPVIVVANGSIVEKSLKNARMNIPLLLSELRLQGYQNIADVQFAIIEPNGKLSVVPKSQARPLQPSDIHLPPSSVSLSFPLVIDGKIIHENLAFLNQNEAWLMSQLKAFTVTTLNDVLLVQMDGQRQMQVIKRDGNIKAPNVT